MNPVFDYFEKQEIPKLILCNPYREPLESLGLAYNIKNTLRFNAISELEFDFPQSTDGGTTIIEAYDKIKTKMVVLVEGIGYYIISECPEDTEGATPVKHISCQSLESELLFRRITSVSGTYKFYDSDNESSSILGLVMKLIPNWGIGYIDSDLLTKYRTFDLDNNTVYNFLISDVAAAFNCVFVFNTIGRSINAYSIPNLNEHSNAYFSFRNINKSVSLTEYSDEMATVLYCYGANGLSIHSVNPLGTNAIYNFDYYKNSNWMSEDLISSLNNWESMADGYQDLYSYHSLMRNTYLDVVIDRKSLVEDMKLTLASLQTTLEGLEAMPDDTPDVSASIVRTENEILDQKVAINKESGNVATAQNSMDLEDAELRKIVCRLKFTGDKVWSSFVSDVSSCLSSITTMSMNWKTIYYSTSDNPAIDVYYLESVRSTIDSSFNYIRTKLGELYILAQLNEKFYWSITPSDIGKATKSIVDINNTISTLYNLLSSIIPYTLTTINLNSVKIKLDSYNTILNYTSNFTENQYLKLQTFFYENTYTNSNIIITDQMNDKEVQEQSQALYDQAIEVLERVSSPRYEFEGDFINIFALKEYEDVISSIDLGKAVKIELASGSHVDPILLEVEYTYDNPTSFNMAFSNRVKLNRSNFKFADLFIDTAGGAGGVSGITGGAGVSTVSPTTITSSTSLTGTNLLSVSNALISKLGYISFGTIPPENYGNNVGVWLGYDAGARISLYSSDTDYLQWDGQKLLVKARNFTLDSQGNITATSADLSGKITASEGLIGGWTIGSTNLYAGTGVNRVAMDSSGGGTPSFYAGSETPTAAPFQVYNDGTLIANTGEVSGWVLSASSLSMGSGSTTVTLDSGGIFPAFSAGSSIVDTAPFRVYSDGRMYATNAYISGSIVAATGSIGGWGITSGCLYAGSGSTTVSLDSVGVNPAFSAGSKVTSTAPFRVYNDGKTYATNAYISGSIYSTSGCIGGWYITSGSLTSGSTLWTVGLSTDGISPAFSAGSRVTSTAPFRVYNDGRLYATSACIVGAVIATSGSIGGWKLSSGSIVSVAGTVGMNSNGTYAFYAGDSTPANAEFSVTHTGDLKSTSGSIGGWSITSSEIKKTGIILNSTTDSIYIGSSEPRLILDGTNKVIKSSNYASGTSGFNISGLTGDAEFNNVDIRGEIKSSVFSYKDVAATAGTLGIFRSAGKLKSNVTTASPASFTIDIEDPDFGHVPLFAVNDILRIKTVGVGVVDNWMTVVGVANMTTYYRYTCYLNYGTPTSASSGNAVLDYGTSGSGFLILTADATNSPYYSVSTHAGAPWNTITEHVRMGNLNGFLDYATDAFGIAIGSSGSYLKYDPVNGLRMAGQIALLPGSTGGGNTTTVSETAPTSPATGDSWYDTSGSILYTWDGSDWYSSEATVSEYIPQFFYQSGSPLSPPANMGDYWIEEGTKKLSRFNGSEWQDVSDSELDTITSVLEVANAAQSTADNKASTFYQSSYPYEEIEIYYSTASPLEAQNLDLWVIGTSASDITGTTACMANINQETGSLGWYELPAGEPSQNDYENFIGDIWYDTDNPLHPLYYYNKIYPSGSSGSYVSFIWEEWSTSACVAQLLSEEPTIFYTSGSDVLPGYPWVSGDVWVPENSGIYRCSTSASAEGSISNWEAVSTPYASGSDVASLIVQVDAMSDDGILSPLEKTSASQLWYIIYQEANSANGTLYVYTNNTLNNLNTVPPHPLYSNLSTSFTNYKSGSSNLDVYLGGSGIDAFNDTLKSASLAIDRAEWDSKWAGYYGYRTELVNVLNQVSVSPVWTNIASLPTSLTYSLVDDLPEGTPTGLYLTTDYMGYWNIDTGWRAYTSKDGIFRLGSIADGGTNLYWDNTNLSITNANINIYSGTDNIIQLGRTTDEHSLPFLAIGTNVTINSGCGIWMGKTTAGDYSFKVGNETSAYLKWDKSELDIVGAEITLGGTVSSPTVRLTSGSGGVIAIGESAKLMTYDSGVGIWMGQDLESAATIIGVSDFDTNEIVGLSSGYYGVEEDNREYIILQTAKYKFRVGNPETKYLAWNGDDLILFGVDITANDITATGSLAVAGATVLSGSLSAIGTTVLTGSLTVTSSIYTSGSLWTDGGLHIGGTSNPGTDNLIVDGKTLISGSLTAAKIYTSGSLWTDGGLHIGGTSDPGTDNLIVDGKTLISGSLTVTGSAAISGCLVVDAYITGSRIYGEIMNPTIENKIVTVGSSKDYATIQEACDFFSGKLCDKCYIDVDAGDYTQSTTLWINAPTGVVTESPYFPFTLRGDTRAIAGLAFVSGNTGSLVPINRPGIANGGSGNCNLSGASYTLTVTGTTTNPNFELAGIVAGDKVYVLSNTLSWTLMNVQSVSSNTITFDALCPTVGGLGSAAVLMPNRWIKSSYAGDSISIRGYGGARLQGFSIQRTDTSSTRTNINVNGCAHVDFDNCVIVGGRHGIGVYEDGIVLHTSSYVLTLISAGQGATTEWRGLCLYGGYAWLRYTQAIGSSKTSAYHYGLSIERGGKADVSNSISVNNYCGVNASDVAFLNASSCAACNNNIGFQAYSHAYLSAGATSTIIFGNTTNYSPTPYSEGNNDAMIGN